MSSVIDAVAALRLVRDLQEALSHDIYFAQGLVNAATVQDVESLRNAIIYGNALRSNILSPALRRQHQNLKKTDRTMRRKTKPSIRSEVRGRVFKARH